MNEESKEVVVQLDLNEENVKVKREEVVLMEEDGREIVGVTKKAIRKERKDKKKEKKLKWLKDFISKGVDFFNFFVCLFDKARSIGR